VLVLLGIAACTSPTEGDEGPSAARLIAEGWLAFEQADYGSAEARFSEALAARPESAEARTGRGWARLRSAGSDADLGAAVTDLEASLQRAPTPDARAGRAVARMAHSAGDRSGAAEDVGSVLSTDPAYRFDHDASVDHRFLLVLQAHAQLQSNNAQGALQTMDAIAASGIVVGDPATWVVDGVRQTSFGAAVAARVGYLTEWAVPGD